MVATISFPYFSAIFLSILIISGFMFPETVNLMGINYGQIANNLPSPDDIVSVVKSIGISKIKFYDADPKVLQAFANTGVEFIVGLPATNITCIFIDNEVLTFNDTSLNNNLLLAMQSVHTTLVGLGLDKQVAITTAHSLSILETSYPPFADALRRDLTGCITLILNFHAKGCFVVLICREEKRWKAFRGKGKG